MHNFWIVFSSLFSEPFVVFLFILLVVASFIVGGGRRK